MNCPECNHEKKLTWKEYMTSPRGYHHCSCCGGSYKVITNYFHIFEIFLAGFIGGGLCMAFCLYQEFSFFEIILFSIIAVVVVILPIDKGFDNHHAKTEMVKESKGIIEEN